MQLSTFATLVFAIMATLAAADPVAIPKADPVAAAAPRRPTKCPHFGIDNYLEPIATAKRVANDNYAADQIPNMTNVTRFYLPDYFRATYTH
ncbi:unnamed protein product [Zymoseptoria tritici ST99CH_1E4]|uniref:Uncharacterized protein n=1 Tax=Zymoseptoria tritici ST99CH_1E4 TaxID=1276532 RepID=A0A2H1GLS2_ZYMTR|nr:unnamed protein product [Zymoseptoria tritici ST99CH_1E4]